MSSDRADLGTSATAAGPALAQPSVPDDHVLILFGATGDLAKRKLLPGMFHLAVAGMMPERYRIVGSGRIDGAPDAEGFRSHVHEALAQFGRQEVTAEDWERFAATCRLRPRLPSSPKRSSTPSPRPSVTSAPMPGG